MKRNVDVSVSTDPIKDYQEVVEYAKSLQGVADFLHCDVMNENFVPKNTYDHVLVKSINRASLIMLDVHLMVAEPTESLEKYVDAGANIITVHYEAFKNKKDLVEAIKYIQSTGTLAGLSIKTTTKFSDVRPYVFGCDVVLVMGVEVGASGQKMDESAVEKVREIAKFREENNLKFKIEFDGGVNGGNAKMLADAGVDILVSGSYVYSSKNRAEAIATLKDERGRA